MLDMFCSSFGFSEDLKPLLDNNAEYVVKCNSNSLSYFLVANMQLI